MEQSKISVAIEALFKIYDKEGKLVDFKLNEIQKRVDREVIKPIEDLKHAHNAYSDEAKLEMEKRLRASILKYRQGGISTLILAWYLIECMYDYACCVMLTHDKEHSEKLLYRARVMLKNMKGPKPITNKLNENEIAFGKTDSLFYIGTAGSKEFGRSATITHLHCSEIAFWKDPARLMKSLFQAVPKTGVIIQETTANGWGNWFQKSYYSYLAGTGGFHPCFYPWYIHDEYYSNTPFMGMDGVPDQGEWLHEKWNLYRRIRKARPDLNRIQILQKLQWRRDKINENQGDQDRLAAIRDFQQEYPATYEEAFVVTGGMLFGRLQRVDDSRWVSDGPGVQRLLGHPHPGYSYAVGGDFSGGTGNDSSSCNVLCLETKEQVYRYDNRYINPVEFAHKLAEVGYMFNTAFLVPEYNSHGIAGTAILKKIYPLTKIYKHVLPSGNMTSGNMNVPSYGYGWKTTATTKPYMVGVAQQFDMAGWKVYDPLTEDQLKSFTEDSETGKIESQASHDDNAISFMLACIGILKLLRIAHLDLEVITDEDKVKAAAVIANQEGQPEVEKPAAPSHRDEQGRFLVPFDDMFATKGRRSQRVHRVN